MGTEWLTLAEILPHGGESLPSSLSKLAETAEREGWRTDASRSRVRFGRGGGYEYHVSLLPADVRARIAVAYADAMPLAAPSSGASSTLWAAFEALPQKAKDEAVRRLQAVDAVWAMASAVTRQVAVAQVCREFDVSRSTLFGWMAQAEGVAKADRLAALAPRYKGRTATVECDPRCWDVLVADYLRPEQPSFESCFERMTRVADAKGWGPVPSSRTLKRRMEREFPRAVLTLARKGRDAAQRIYPHQRRDKSVFHALQAVNSDGHKFDVFVKWEDGTISRPIMLGIQDLYSGTLLAYRIDRTESKELVRLAIADLVTKWGVPELCFLDNGRAFASKWITGRMANRFRFTVKDEEPQGILTALGVDVRWTTPYHGQAKPIERAWRDLCDRVAKHPAFAGAYTGNKPDAKPENYGSAAVPVATFRAVVAAEIDAHNRREGRRSATTNGRSFLATLQESLERPETMVKRATEAQRRMLLLAAEGVTVKKPTAEIELMGTRYWDEALVDHMGRKVVVRFDPQDLAAPLGVYALDGRWICAAEAISDVAFADSDAARAHNRRRAEFLRAQRDYQAAEQRLSIDEMAALMPETAQPDEPTAQPKVTKLVANAGSRAWSASEDFSRGVELLAQGQVLPFGRKTEADTDL